jgi:hypothetical protein
MHRGWAGRSKGAVIGRAKLRRPAIDMLVAMNDGVSGVKRKTFRGIATWIERNL